MAENAGRCDNLITCLRGRRTRVEGGGVCFSQTVLLSKENFPPVTTETNEVRISQLKDILLLLALSRT